MMLSAVARRIGVSYPALLAVYRHVEEELDRRELTAMSTEEKRA
jgi:hypothetical protein